PVPHPASRTEPVIWSALSMKGCCGLPMSQGAWPAYIAPKVLRSGIMVALQTVRRWLFYPHRDDERDVPETRSRSWTRSTLLRSRRVQRPVEAENRRRVERPAGEAGQISRAFRVAPP